MKLIDKLKQVLSEIEELVPNMSECIDVTNLQELIKELSDMEEFAMHTHQVDLRLSEDYGDIDTCCLCRHDIRHSIHKKWV